MKLCPRPSSWPCHDQCTQHLFNHQQGLDLVEVASISLPEQQFVCDRKHYSQSTCHRWKISACNEVIVRSGGLYIKILFLFFLQRHSFYDRHSVFVEWTHNLGSRLMKGSPPESRETAASVMKTRGQGVWSAGAAWGPVSGQGLSALA